MDRGQIQRTRSWSKGTRARKKERAEGLPRVASAYGVAMADSALSQERKAGSLVHAALAVLGLIKDRRQGSGTDYSLHPGIYGLSVNGRTLSTTRKTATTGDGLRNCRREPARTASNDSRTEGCPS